MNRESLLSKTVWTAAGTVASAFAAAMVTIVAARILGPTSAGILAYAVWFSSMVLGISNLGLHQAIPRFIAEQQGRAPEMAEPLGRWMFRAAFPVIGLGIAATWFGWGFVRDAGEGWAFRAILCCVFALQTTAMLYLGVLSGLQRFRAAASYNAIAGLLLAVAVTLGVWVGGPVGGLVGYGFGSVATVLGALRFAIGGTSTAPSKVLNVRIAKYALSQWLSGLLAILVWMKGELFFLERYWGAREVGLYTAGLSLAQMAQQAPLLLSGALVPHFSEMVGADRLDSVKETYASATRIMALLVLPACFWLAGLCPVVLPLVFGRAYASAVPSAVVLISTAVIGVIGSTSASVVNALEKSRYLAWTSALLAMIALASYRISIPTWGSVGAAWGRALVQVLAAVIGYAYMQWWLKIPTPFGAMARMLIAAATSAATGSLLACWLGGLLGILCAIPVMVLSYGLLVRLLRAISAHEANRLQHAVSRLPVFLANLALPFVRFLSPEELGKL